jgi:asparagine synthase (glutamine-hydrolysing)
MCGIAGKISFNSNAVEKQELKKMTDAIAHRGPDGEGQWVNIESNVGFGHRRLAIIDLSEKSRQPMTFGTISITFNGEIYNYLEIKNDLIKKGHSFKTDSDTEVIINAYLEYGEGCVNHFDGMFAFAIWDDNKKELFGARDRFGEKPFYYHHDSEQFVFASEMKAIFEIGISKQVSEKMIYQYLAYNVVENPLDKSETFYKNIFQIPPAHFVRINLDSNIEIRRYWDLDLNHQVKISENDAKERFQELFSQSIQRRLRSDVPVGSSFSGGLDSSSVVGSILKQNPSLELNTFTARFKDNDYDEGAFIDFMTKEFQFKTNYCWPEENLIIDELDRIFHHQEEPFGSTSIIAQWEVMKLAKEKNVTVLLDGQGADETLAGYYKYFEPFLAELYKLDKSEFKKELTAIENNLSMENILPRGFVTEMNFPKLKKQLGDVTRPFRMKNIAEDLSEAFRGSYKKQPNPFNRLTNLNEFLYFDTFNYGLGKLLRFSDRNAMAHSREVRLPYLSHELVEFAFALPTELKMNQGWSKYILRKSMEDTLPKEITWRKDKKGFQAPKSWLDNERVEDLVNDSISKLIKEKIIDKPISSNNWKYIMCYKLLNNG